MLVLGGEEGGGDGVTVCEEWDWSVWILGWRGGRGGVRDWDEV